MAESKQRPSKLARDETMHWTPRRGKWRKGLSPRDIEFERRIVKYLRLGQRQISADRHSSTTSKVVGGERGEGTWTVGDPVHGAITTRGLEEELATMPLLARLQHVKQNESMLATFLPGAIGDRYQHAVGTMHMTGRIAGTLKLPREDRAKLRLAGLLHDVGHAAFSHASEPFIVAELGKDHDQLAEDRMRAAGVPTMLAKHGIDFDEILQLSRGEGLGEIITELADRMDYLQRDARYLAVNQNTRVKLRKTIEEVIRNLRLRKGKVYLTPKGEAAYKKLADFRSIFYAGLYFHPASMLTRHLLRRAIGKGLKKGVITTRELVDGEDDAIVKKLQRSGIPEAEHIKELGAHLHFSQVYAARFTHLKPGARQENGRAAVAKLQQALRGAGLGEHEFYADATPNVDKPVTYRVLEGGKVTEKTYQPTTPGKNRIVFAVALDSKLEHAKGAIGHAAKTLTRQTVLQPAVMAPPKIATGGKLVFMKMPQRKWLV